MQAVGPWIIMCRSCPSGAASAFKLVLWDEQGRVREGWECQGRDGAELLDGGLSFGSDPARGCAGEVGKGTGLSAAGQDGAPVGFPGHTAEPCPPAERTLGRAGARSVPLRLPLFGL